MNLKLARIGQEWLADILKKLVNAATSWTVVCKADKPIKFTNELKVTFAVWRTSSCERQMITLGKLSTSNFLESTIEGHFNVPWSNICDCYEANLREYVIKSGLYLCFFLSM